MSTHDARSRRFRGPTTVLWCSVTLILAILLPVRSATNSGTVSCGIRKAQNGTIYPGVAIEPGEWPWHTLIYYWSGSRLDPPSRICEGALLSDRFVLAAAHCLSVVRGARPGTVGHGELLPAHQLVVHVGAVSVQQDNEHSHRFQVRNVTVEDESDLALIELLVVPPEPKLIDELALEWGDGSGIPSEELLPTDNRWKSMPVCLVNALDLTTLYGAEMYILNQSQRNRLGGYEPVRLVLDEFLLCSGSTLAMKARSINSTTISFTIKDLNLPSNDRGTALYFKHRGTWALLGFTVSRANHQWTPGSVCLPTDIITFDILYPALHWVMDALDYGDSANS
ncbi:putative serine protease 29 [Anopheles aquasalis]|uniref:putative serine protease 29 n=1 Tax=Anopheles aquasalis TaxID=42839 RepID=UPI00215A9309|nr:putative serine protease 29 [Anopheles aquasalis]